MGTCKEIAGRRHPIPHTFPSFSPTPFQTLILSLNSYHFTLDLCQLLLCCQLGGGAMMTLPMSHFVWSERGTKASPPEALPAWLCGVVIPAPQPILQAWEGAMTTHPPCHLYLPAGGNFCFTHIAANSMAVTVGQVVFPGSAGSMARSSTALNSAGTAEPSMASRVWSQHSWAWCSSWILVWVMLWYLGLKWLSQAADTEAKAGTTFSSSYKAWEGCCRPLPRPGSEQLWEVAVNSGSRTALGGYQHGQRREVHHLHMHRQWFCL